MYRGCSDRNGQLFRYGYQCIGRSGSGHPSVPQNSGISPVSATFDLNPNGTDHAAIPVTVTWNGNTLTGITNGGYTLKQGTDYTVSGNVYTINTSYLDTLAVGTVNLIFNFSAGNPATLAVTVENTTPALGGLTINPVSGAYSAPLTVTISDNSLSGNLFTTPPQAIRSRSAAPSTPVVCNII